MYIYIYIYIRCRSRAPPRPTRWLPGEEGFKERLKSGF